MATASDIFEVIDDAGALQQLIAAGVDVERRDDQNCTPLFYAVLAGNLISVRLLVEAGADVNAIAGEPGRTILAPTPLSLAMQCRQLMNHEKYDPIAQELVAAGASLNWGAQT